MNDERKIRIKKVRDSIYKLAMEVEDIFNDEEHESISTPEGSAESEQLESNASALEEQAMALIEVASELQELIN